MRLERQFSWSVRSGYTGCGSELVRTLKQQKMQEFVTSIATASPSEPNELAKRTHEVITELTCSFLQIARLSDSVRLYAIRRVFSTLNALKHFTNIEVPYKIVYGHY